MGVLSGEFYANNVTIKNSTVIGHRNVGGFIGNISGILLNSANGISLENVDVKTVGGMAGIVAGYSNTTDDRINVDSNGKFISFELHDVLSRVIQPHCPLRPAQDVNHFFVQLGLTNILSYQIDCQQHCRAVFK